MILLTPNQRMAYFLQQKYNNTKTQIFALDNWLQETWQSASTALPRLLTEFQMTVIWQHIIAQSTYATTLLNPAATANEAIAAWQLLKAWRIPLSQLNNFTEDNYQAFSTWAKAFINYCTQQAYIDHGSMIDALCKMYQQKKILIPQHIMLIGFDHITPQFNYLLKILKQHQCHIEHQTEKNINATTARMQFADPNTEIRHMAQWAQHCHKQGAQRIACIIPDLNVRYQEVSYIFSQYCDEVTISISPAFDRYPLIYTALQILSLNHSPWTINHLSYLLRSPHILLNNCTMTRRHQFDALLRHQGRREITPANFIELCEKKEYPELAEIYKRFIALSDAAIKNPLSIWANLFTQQLKILGWPNQADSNLKLVERFKKLLEEFSNLNVLSDHLDHQAALHLLTQLTQATLFQVNDTENISIHILGILEAAGLPFDQMWIAGMHAEQWPLPVNPNAFLPITIQRNLKMPHANAPQALLFSQKLTQRLCDNTKHIIFSFPQYDGNRSLSPSQLILAYPEMHFSNLTIPLSPRRAEYQTDYQFELLQDEQAPRVISTEMIKGGTTILKQQAACPFQAFTELRLHAKSFVTVHSGLNAKQRGIIIHKILENIWGKFADQSTLQNSLLEQRDQIIRDCIDHALIHFHLTSNYRKLEIAYLTTLINKWLDFEASRSTPFRVIEREKDEAVKIGDMTIQTRIDRIDELADGSLVIIDYKTGEPHINDWFGERPQQPQLPIYCAYTNNAVNAVKQVWFARLHTHDYYFAGMTTEEKSDYRDVKPLHKITKTTAKNWEDQLQQWKNNLKNILQEYVTGYAAVTPYRGLQTCMHCKLSEICRIHEMENNTHDDITT